ncbi:MAG TPA: SRPBCC family protein [Acidimicrobiia bacterium]|nr:SRPBCC family protein [Acidimicrobiia bacterium]
MVEVTANGRSSAPPERVWAVLAAKDHWSDWSMFDSVDVERPGDPAPHGRGAIHEYATGKFRTREEVLAFEPPGHYAYALLSGIRGLKNYRADVTLTAAGDGTAIEWRSRFDVFALLAPVARRRVHQIIQRMVDDLARAASAGSRAP